MNDQKRLRAVLFLALFTPFFAAAQTAFDDSLGLAVAPGLTPVVADDRTEIGFFNAFSTFLASDSVGSRVAQATHFLQIQRGMSPRNRFSAGFDLVFSNLRFGPTDEIAPFGAFGKSPTSGLSSHALTAVGLRARFVPMLRRPEFSLQGAVFFPVAAQLDRVLMGEDRIRFSVQANYATLFAAGWHVVAQVAPQVRIKNDDRRQTSLETPVNAYLIRRIWRGRDGQRAFLFANAGFFSAFERRFKAGLRQTNWYSSAGLGGQFAFIDGASLSFGWQILPALDAATGIRKGSFQSFSVGGRRVF